MDEKSGQGSEENEAVSTHDTSESAKSQTPPEAETMSKNRVEAFSDGVFAFAATVLGLDVHLPIGLSPGALNHALMTMGPRLLAYALSFAIIGVYWVAHHVMLHAMRQVDRTLLWLNLLLLMMVALLPFSAALLGNYPTEQSATLVYGANLTLTSSAFLVFWLYACRIGRLLKTGISPLMIRSGFGRTFTSVVLYMLGMAASFISTRISLTLYGAVPLAYIFVQGFLDRGKHWSPEHLEAMAKEVDAEAKKVPQVSPTTENP